MVSNLTERCVSQNNKIWRLDNKSFKSGLKVINKASTLTNGAMNFLLLEGLFLTSTEHMQLQTSCCSMKIHLYIEKYLFIFSFGHST